MAYYGWRNDRSRGARDLCRLSREDHPYVVWLLDRGHSVRILMGDQADRRAVDDLICAVRSMRPARTGDALAFAPAQTLHDVMQQIADTDLVVATRYHNVVCALRMGRPTISIGYSEKNDDLLAEMGLADYCQNIERLDVLLLESQTLRLIAERAASRSGSARRACASKQPAPTGGRPGVADPGAAGSCSPRALARDPAT